VRSFICVRNPQSFVLFLGLCLFYNTLHVDIDHFGPTSLETINIKDVIKGKHIVVHEDLSNGQEPVPIPCVIDEDVLRPCSCASCRENGANTSGDIAEPWICFNYINKRLLDPSLGLDTEVTFLS